MPQPINETQDKENPCTELLNTTILASGLGFFAGIDFLVRSKSNDFLIPLLLTTFGAVVGLGIGSGVFLFNKVMDSLHTRFSNPSPPDSLPLS